jgi:hypothetical protein
MTQRRAICYSQRNIFFKKKLRVGKMVLVAPAFCAGFAII